MKSLFSIFALFLLLFPLKTFALCSPEGYTVVYVNGVWTEKGDAGDQLNDLQRSFNRYSSLRGVVFRNGYNLTHLGGGGDLLESIAQAFGKSISDYDLNTILIQIHPELTTRKILLLGHSQGTFYTDEMYQYLIMHGVPKQAIMVYNIATPESFVAGGGGYLTSTNDKVINTVRDDENNGNLQVYLNSDYTITSNVVNSALRANITIPKEVGWDADPQGGHDISRAYLNGAADRIVHDIDGELGMLNASGNADSPDGCFTPPTPTVAYKAQEAVLAVSDPLVGGAASAGAMVQGSVFALANGAQNALSSLWNMLGIGSATGQIAAAAVPLEEEQSSTPSSTDGTPANPPVPETVSVPPVSVVATDEPSTPVQPQTPSTTPPVAQVPPSQSTSTSLGFVGGGWR
jgi:hypothetical protein